MVARASVNEVRQFEPSFSSDFICWMESNGINTPDPSAFNLILTNTAGPTSSLLPAFSCSYDDYEVTTESITFGPGITVDVPVFNPIYPKTVTINVIDNYMLNIRQACIDWSLQLSEVSEGRGMSLDKLQEYSMKLKVQWFNRDRGRRTSREEFIILPPTSFSDGGDDTFSIDSFSLTFPVIGFFHST